MDEDIFEAVRVTSAEAQRAYGLVVLSHPDVGIAEWKRFVRPLGQAARKDSGIIALRDRRSCIHALFAFRVAQTLGREVTLQVTEIAVLRLPGTVLIDALLRFANDLAAELSLPSIAIDLQPSAVWRQDRQALEKQGFALDRVMMRGKAGRPRTVPAKI